MKITEVVPGLALVTAFLIFFLAKALHRNSLQSGSVPLADTVGLADNRYRTGEQYLRLDVLQIDTTEQQATLRITWDASWRDGENWDAAWVCLKSHHRNSLPTHLTIKEVRLQGNANTPADAVMQIPEDKNGFFIYRQQMGQGTNDWTVQIDWSGPSDTENLQAYGVEMVYVPRGAFQLGTVKSISGRRTSNADWVPYTSPAPLSALFRASPGAEEYYGGVYEVNSDAEISIGTGEGDLYYIDAPFLKDFSSGDQTGTLSRAFPKGYRAFYQMKYELTQGQYVAFLNALPPALSARHWLENPGPENIDPETFRYTIQRERGRYVTPHPYRAAVYISWCDALAWADWMGLRPMTGLEYEKSARGPQPLEFREFVWGVSERDRAEAFRKNTRITDEAGDLADEEDGTERVDGNVHVFLRPTIEGIEDPCSPGGSNYYPSYPACRELKGGDADWGPLRVGIHGVDSGGDRIRAGASYYGAMELGGNANELIVPLGHPGGRAFRGTHGDGILSREAEATNADWLASADADVYGTRGGAWISHPNHARIADRFGGLKQNSNARLASSGFRGVRSLPE